MAKGPTPPTAPSVLAGGACSSPSPNLGRTSIRSFFILTRHLYAAHAEKERTLISGTPRGRPCAARENYSDVILRLVAIEKQDGGQDRYGRAMTPHRGGAPLRAASCWLPPGYALITVWSLFSRAA